MAESSASGAAEESGGDDASALSRLIGYARPWRGRIRIAAACSITNKVLDIAPPALIGMAVDIVVKREDSLMAGWGIPDPADQLVALAILTVLVWVGESVFEYAYAVLWRNLAQDIQHALRLDAYSHTQRLGLAWYEDNSTGGLMAILNDDVNQLERFLDGGANDLLQVATTVVVIGGAFLWLAPGVAVVALLPIPLVVWGSFAFQKRIAPRYATVRDRVGRLNALLANNLSGITTIKSFVAEEREVERVRAESLDYRSANSSAIRLSSAFSPLIRMAIVLGFTATLVVGGRMALAGTLAIGTYSVLVFLTQRLLWPLTRLGQTFDLYHRAMASTTRVLDLLDLEPEPDSGELAPESVDGEFRLEGVSFRYGNGAEVLRDVDLTIPAGKTTALVGATGAGKTSLIKLLLRFYEASEGRVLLDGHDIREWRLGALRRAIGLVSQDVFLFHGTVRENLAYGRPDASDEDLRRAARLAEAEDFIDALPQGFDTVVGERGQKLSGGQRQRLSIARALLHDPPVLIFDEATSAVDNETEAALQRSLRRISEDRTVIVIAHRLSTVRHADQIAVLEGGGVTELGRHEDLIDSGGLYAALWRVQTGSPQAGSPQTGSPQTGSPQTAEAP